MRRAQRGFTLIELMIVVAVMGVLMAIALPQYSEYVLKGKLTEGITQLSTMQTRMEQYYQDNRTYAGAAACASPVSDCGICPSTATGLKYFALTCATSNTGQRFTYTATSTGLGTPEFVYTVNEANTKATTAVPADWTTGAACWVRSKGGC